MNEGRQKNPIDFALVLKPRTRRKQCLVSIVKKSMENKNALKQHFGNLGDYLKSKREQQNLTQIEVAKACQCQSQFVSNWERGQCSPPWDILKKLIKIYDIPERQIYNFLMKEYEKLILTNLGIKKVKR